MLCDWRVRRPVAGRRGATGSRTAQDREDPRQDLYERRVEGRAAAVSRPAAPRPRPRRLPRAVVRLPRLRRRAGAPAAGAGKPARKRGRSRWRRPRPHQPPRREGRGDWRASIQASKDALSRAQIFAEALQSRINGLSTDFTARDDPAQRADRWRRPAEVARRTGTREEGNSAAHQGAGGHPGRRPPRGRPCRVAPLNGAARSRAHAPARSAGSPRRGQGLAAHDAAPGARGAGPRRRGGARRVRSGPGDAPDPPGRRADRL